MILLGSHHRKLPTKVGQLVDDFLLSYNEILGQYAPSKKKYAKVYQPSFMIKNLSKAIMLRAKLWNIFLKNRTEENKA